jgi:hypothetical protein
MLQRIFWYFFYPVLNQFFFQRLGLRCSMNTASGIEQGNIDKDEMSQIALGRLGISSYLQWPVGILNRAEHDCFCPSHEYPSTAIVTYNAMSYKRRRHRRWRLHIYSSARYLIVLSRCEGVRRTDARFLPRLFDTIAFLSCPLLWALRRQDMMTRMRQEVEWHFW